MVTPEVLFFEMLHEVRTIMNKLCQISAMFQLSWAVELMRTRTRAVNVMARGQEEVRKELCIAEGFSEVGGS